MKTINEHVSILRTLFKKYSDDTIYSSEFLANVFNSAATRLKAQKSKNLSTQDYLPICMRLEKTKFHDCSCIPEAYGCNVLKTIEEIPNMIAYTVIDGDGDEIPYITIQEYSHLKTSKTKKNRLTHTIYDNKIVVFGSLNRKVIIINAAWSNPLDLADLTNCDTNGDETSQCFIAETTPYPLQEELEMTAYLMVRDLLSAQFPDDKINNTMNENE